MIILNFNLSCKKFLDIESPKDKISTSKIFENDDIATSAITGIYSRMIDVGFGSGDNTSISILTGLSSDELKNHNSTWDGFSQAEIQTNDPYVAGLWSKAYTFIYSANAVLEGLEVPNSVSPNTKSQLMGEAKFVRAFCYFYLVNLFGEIPLNLTTDYRINEVAQKSSKEKIYAQIITDLQAAENLLSAAYPSTERIRPNKWTAKSLLARVYLFTENWKLASDKATEVIDQKGLYTLVDDLDKVFLKNSTETIWQLMPPAGNNTREGALFILTATPGFVSLLPSFVTTFEPGDVRLTKWIKEYSNNTGKYYYPFKYKVKTSSQITEYSMVIRLAELYLIRAEARAKQSQPELALEDINLIRKRAGLINPLIGFNSSQCLIEIEKQNRLELFTEWGHRWLDLKRTGRASSILAPIKGLTWQETDVLYPIPDIERTRNKTLKQNLGY